MTYLLERTDDDIIRRLSREARVVKSEGHPTITVTVITITVITVTAAAAVYSIRERE